MTIMREDPNSTIEKLLDEKIEAHSIIYRINTGIGGFLEVILSDEQVREFQK